MTASGGGDGPLRLGRDPVATLLSALSGRDDRPLARGLLLSGLVWPGAHATPAPGEVLVDPAGLLAGLGPPGSLTVAAQVPRVEVGWVGPGLVDAHVHLAFGGPELALAGGLVAVRDLGAPMGDAQRWRTHPGRGAPGVAVAGPLLTGPGGYPLRGWGAGGFGLELGAISPAAAVAQLVGAGVDVVKVALEPAGGGGVPSAGQLAAVVSAAHDAGLAVSAHALSAAMVSRALAAGVDELAHCPVEALPEPLIDGLASAGVAVVSTLQTLIAGGERATAATAQALHRGGVELIYGTDLGNTATQPGVDPRELDRLAATGLGRLGALQAASLGAARAAGLRGRGGTGTLATATVARLVCLTEDPVVEPAAWTGSMLTVAGPRVVARSGRADAGERSAPSTPRLGR